MKLYSVVDGKVSEETVDTSLVTFKERTTGKDTPMTVYTDGVFVYDVDVFYNGEALKDKAGNAITFKAYIGVKGDSNLDGKADAKDASNALAYYAKVSTLAEGVDINTLKVCQNTEDADLDQLGAFLVDVDKDVYDADNWKTYKDGRVIDAKDASYVLAYYAQVSTGQDDLQAAWNKVILDREEKITPFLNK